MADDMHLDARLGRSLNRALLEGDIVTFFPLFAQYLASNGLKIPAAAIDDLARNGLIETQ